MKKLFSLIIVIGGLFLLLQLFRSRKEKEFVTAVNMEFANRLFWIRYTPYTSLGEKVVYLPFCFDLYTDGEVRFSETWQDYLLSLESKLKDIQDYKAFYDTIIQEVKDKSKFDLTLIWSVNLCAVGRESATSYFLESVAPAFNFSNSEENEIPFVAFASYKEITFIPANIMIPNLTKLVKENVLKLSTSL